MAALQPLYTPSNCTFSGPLRWGVTIFWRAPPPALLPQAELAAALERDGVRLLGHRFCEPRVSQFALSTLAETTPLHVVSRLKGRLQYLIRASVPKAFQRNYALRSFGPATRAAVEAYVAAQVTHHPRADPRVQTMLERHQIQHADVDLSRPRTTAHAIYWYNLHIVLVHRERWAEVREEVFGELAGMIERVSRAKSFALSRAGLLPDHIHLTLGCPIEVAPAEVVLAFLNNLAFVHGHETRVSVWCLCGDVWRVPSGSGCE